MSMITSIQAREILDSRGYPTIETEVLLENGVMGISSVPSGASTGSFEAVELRDGGERFFGKGVLQAVSNVNNTIAPEILGTSVLDQKIIDQLLINIDGTENKSNLGANATLSVSLAVCHAAANFLEIPLYQYLGGITNTKLPRPMMNIINGGAHADNKIDIQEFMIVPAKETNFKDYVVMCATIYHNLKKTLKSKNFNINVGDEGGVAPNFSSTNQAMDYIMQAIENSGFQPDVDVQIALDSAASEFFHDGLYSIDGTKKNASEMIEFYRKLASEYPIVSIEDPLSEEDWSGWVELTSELGGNIQIVGDDLFVTNKKRLLQGIQQKAANAILTKPNQIGTLSETFETINTAKDHGYNVIISHRSGETEDTTIADLAVAVRAKYIKTGAPARGERIAKYNQLIRIEEELLNNC